MSSHRLLPSHRAVLRRRVLRGTVPVMLIAVALIAGLNVSRGETEGLFVAIPVVMLALAFGLFNGYRRQVRVFDSFELDVNERQLTRTMTGAPLLVLSRDEVTKIEEHAGGELSVHVPEKMRSLRIPAQIEGRDELRATLAQWMPIEPAPAVRSQLWSTLTGLFVVIGFFTTMVVTNPLVVAIVGTALVVTIVASLVLIQRNPQADERLRRISWIGIVPAIAILVRVLAALRQL